VDPSADPTDKPALQTVAAIEGGRNAETLSFLMTGLATSFTAGLAVRDAGDILPGLWCRFLDPGRLTPDGGVVAELTLARRG
jgi:hypothetical protein